jgi:segregation and condensation protein B
MVITRETLDEIEKLKERDAVKKLEAIFFVAGKFLSMSELVSLSDLNPLIIKEYIEKLKEKYNNENSAISIIEKNNMWKMDVQNEYSYIINKLATGSSEFSKAEQETLAIIAYKQPIKQSVIVKIRGNKAYDHISKFADFNLIKKKKQGHTHILTLSGEFYDYFNVSPDENLAAKELFSKVSGEENSKNDLIDEGGN